MMLGLLVWFYVELATGSRQLGLAERVLAGVEAVWPLAVILTCRWEPKSGTRAPVRRPSSADQLTSQAKDAYIQKTSPLEYVP